VRWWLLPLISAFTNGGEVMAKKQKRHTVRKILLLLWNFTTIPIAVQVGRLERKWTLRELLFGIFLMQLVFLLF
jgi:hypothetical protein